MNGLSLPYCPIRDGSHVCCFSHITRSRTLKASHFSFLRGFRAESASYQSTHRETLYKSLDKIRQSATVIFVTLLRLRMRSVFLQRINLKSQNIIISIGYISLHNANINCSPNFCMYDNSYLLQWRELSHNASYLLGFDFQAEQH